MIKAVLKVKNKQVASIRVFKNDLQRYDPKEFAMEKAKEMVAEYKRSKAIPLLEGLLKGDQQCTIRTL